MELRKSRNRPRLVPASSLPHKNPFMVFWLQNSYSESKNPRTDQSNVEIRNRKETIRLRRGSSSKFTPDLRPSWPPSFHIRPLGPQDSIAESCRLPTVRPCPTRKKSCRLGKCCRRVRARPLSPPASARSP